MLGFTFGVAHFMDLSYLFPKMPNSPFWLYLTIQWLITKQILFHQNDSWLGCNKKKKQLKGKSLPARILLF